MIILEDTLKSYLSEKGNCLFCIFEALETNSKTDLAWEEK